MIFDSVYTGMVAFKAAEGLKQNLLTSTVLKQKGTAVAAFIVQLGQEEDC